jgi:hypothetical protein
MNAVVQQWNLLSARLGVKPRQFAILSAVLAVAVFGLGLKYAPRSAQKISRSTVVKASTQLPENQIQSSEMHATTVSLNGSDAQQTPQDIEISLDRPPTRDPFKAFGAPEVESVKNSYAPIVVQTKTPGLLPGLMLKAVIRGELAVFGDQTVRIGDALALPDGTFASVRAIADRSVTVDYDNRVIEVCFGASAQSKPAVSGVQK